jgi:ceramide glucosyltransferase
MYPQSFSMEGALLILFAVLTGCAIGYYAVALLGALSYLRRPRADAPFAPPLTLLKPLKGADPEAYENFRSHCLQEYPAYQIVFGVSDPADPAVPLVERLREEFPGRDIALVIAPEALGANRKVSALLRMLPAARHPFLLINDGDIRVPPGYLARVMAPFSSSEVGMVTALYRGVAGRSLGSCLEAFGISTEFSPGVLAARFLEGGLRFGLGSTLAFRRDALESAGGFEPLLDYLADDYELGRRIAEGARIELADTVVETVLPAYSLAGAWRHELRWGRTQRACRPGGYAGRVFTFGLLWGALALLLSRGAPWGWGLFAAAAVLRLVLALLVGTRILGDRKVLGNLWLLPLRELFSFCVWIASFLGRRIVWRGEAFILQKGKLRPVVR